MHWSGGPSVPRRPSLNYEAGSLRQALSKEQFMKALSSDSLRKAVSNSCRWLLHPTHRRLDNIPRAAYPPVDRRRMMQRLLLACSFACATLAVAVCAKAQATEGRHITVGAEELPSAYGAPPDLSHGRISTLTKSYVLSPYSFELEAGYELSLIHI